MGVTENRQAAATAEPPAAAGPTDRRILEAATVLFCEKGYHAATMREVAAAAGLKAGSLYNHYASKQELLLRIAAGTMEDLLAGGVAAVRAHVRPRDRLRALITAHVVYHAERRARARVADEQLSALEGANRDAVLRIRDEYEQLLKDVLDAGRKAHGWAVPDTPVVTFAISTMCTAVDTWYRPDGRLTPREIADLYSDFVLGALERRDHANRRSLAGS